MSHTPSTCNVDPSEIHKFDTKADAWWDKDGPFATLHAINPLRLGFINKTAQEAGILLCKARVLDLGCGGGILSMALAKCGAKVTGLDMGEANIQAAKARLDVCPIDPTPDFICQNVLDYAKTHAGTFDIICCMEMLEHVPEPALILQACATLLRQGGILVTSTLNRNTKSRLFAIIGAERILKLLPKGTHDFDKFITPAELDKLITQAGLVRGAITGLHYNPLTGNYWLSGANVDVNYFMAATKIQP